MRSGAVGGLLAIAVLVGACSKDQPPTVQLYDKAPVPAVPDRTSAITEPLADGDYWAVSVGVTGDRLGFTFQQAFFGPACAEELGAGACTEEPGVREQPSTELAVTTADLRSVTVAGADRQNYAVTADELAGLVAGGSPAPQAPAGFTFVPYPFLVTVRNGVAVEAHQIWVP